MMHASRACFVQAVTLAAALFAGCITAAFVVPGTSSQRGFAP